MVIFVVKLNGNTKYQLLTDLLKTRCHGAKLFYYLIKSEDRCALFVSFMGYSV